MSDSGWKVYAMVFRLTRVVVLLCLFVTTVGPRLKAEPDPLSRGYEGERSGLRLDYAAFFDTDSAKIRIELYFQFFNSLLSFTPDSGSYKGAYEVVIRVKDKDGRQVDSYTVSREIRVADRMRTQSRTDFRTNQANFYLDPGKYVVEFTFSDKNSDVALYRQLKLKLKGYEARVPRLSDIELVMAVGPVQDSPSPFDKGDISVVPMVSHSLGRAEENRLVYYMEIYRGSDSTESVFVETSLRRRWGSLVYRDSLTTQLDGSTVRQLREISIADMVPGEYELEVRLRGRRNKKLDDKRHVFYIEWTQETMLRHDYDVALDLLNNVATRKELKKLKQAETYEARVAAVDAFWQSRDPSPGTVVNELKNEFYRRVRFANRSFGFMRKPGWRTDRGRVYLRHGEPDQIDDFPLAMDRRPYQEWHYYRGGGYRKFTFVDEDEDGDYRLVYPYDGLHLQPDF